MRFTLNKNLLIQFLTLVGALLGMEALTEGKASEVAEGIMAVVWLIQALTAAFAHTRNTDGSHQSIAYNKDKE